MPLLDTHKTRSPMSTWWMASWLVGIATWIVLIQLFVWGSATFLNSGMVRLMLFVGVILSAVDGLTYVRGGIPHHPERRKEPRPDVRVLDETPQGVVVMNHLAPATPKKEKTGPAHIVFSAAPRALGDVVLTAVWKLAAKVSGRDERVMLGATNDYPTGEFPRATQHAVVQRREPRRYRIFRP